MFNSICNNKGISLVEVSIALFLLSIGILALVSLQPSAWRLAGRSDYLGRASGILQTQLQINEARIMNPNTVVSAGTTTGTVYPGGQSTPKLGDAPFSVQTTTASLGGNSWLVTVNVTWPGNATGISESLRVIRQEYFRQ
jgi:Tfp pilus assembly protein PilV